MFQFLYGTSKVLPCRLCCQHFNNYVTRFVGDEVDSSLPLQNRESLSRFLVDAHNDVNMRLGKTNVAYDSVKRDYMFAPEGGSPSPSMVRLSLLWTVLIVLVLLAAVHWYRISSRRRTR